MKTILARIFAGYAAVIAFGLVFTTAFATVTTPVPDSSLNLVLTNAGAVSLSISNAGDQVWIIQSSSDFANWTNVASWKIHNGIYHNRLTNAVNPKLFYRALYDPSQQNISSTTTNALVLPATNYPYSTPSLPASFSVSPIAAEDNTPNNNAVTDVGATLGRVLFYDRRLSTNQTISCASCHQQAVAFSDSRQFSVGYNGSLGTRNAMGLSNARWYQRKKFFWDERAATLEDQTLQPIQNPIEMGMTLEALTNRLAAEPFYTNLFTLAFGSPAVTTNLISRALAQFVRSIISVQSKYDIGVTNNFANFTAQENLGRQLFFGQTGTPPPSCAVCHATDNFVPTTTLNNNGLEYPYVDLGVGGITGVTAQNGLFKVPSLRNIALTAPYMHDGRFSNLTQVVNFYSTNVVFGPNLSPPLLTRGG
ncbi:MAG TPA: cytochrome c peroxidase, partial [Verrucomicrobiae bacterium]